MTAVAGYPVFRGGTRNRNAYFDPRNWRVTGVSIWRNIQPRVFDPADRIEDIRVERWREEKQLEKRFHPFIYPHSIYCRTILGVSCSVSLALALDRRRGRFHTKLLRKYHHKLSTVDVPVIFIFCTATTCMWHIYGICICCSARRGWLGLGLASAHVELCGRAELWTITGKISNTRQYIRYALVVREWTVQFHPRMENNRTHVRTSAHTHTHPVLRRTST